MALIRVPFPKEPERRQAVLDKARADLRRFGVIEGTAESGVFHGSTPIGPFAGSYRSPAGTEEIEIEVIKKPWLVTTSMIESEVRRKIARA